MAYVVKTPAETQAERWAYQTKRSMRVEGKGSIVFPFYV